MKYAIIVLVIGVVVGMWSHMDENNTDVIFPKKLKGKFKTGFLYQILTCILAASLSVMLDFAAGLEGKTMVVTLHAFLAALAGKGFLISQARKYEQAQQEALKAIEDRLSKETSNKSTTNKDEDKSNTGS